MTAALSIDNLRVDYGDYTAVNDLSLTLARSDLLRNVLEQGFDLKAFSSGKPDIEALLMKLIEEKSH